MFAYHLLIIEQRHRAEQFKNVAMENRIGKTVQEKTQSPEQVKPEFFLFRFRSRKTVAVDAGA